MLYELSTRSLWLDESATVAITAQHGSALWDAIARDGGNMLGYYLMLHVLTGVFGHAPALIRAPSAVGFVGTVAIVCMIAMRLFDRRAALAAGLLTAVSLPLVFWGQDARGYALMTMFIAASFLALIALIEDPSVEAQLGCVRRSDGARDVHELRRGAGGAGPVAGAALAPPGGARGALGGRGARRLLRPDRGAGRHARLVLSCSGCRRRISSGSARWLGG